MHVAPFPEHFEHFDFTANAAASVKASSGHFLGGNVYNPGGVTVWVQIHDAAPGSQSATTIVESFAIPAGASLPIGVGWAIQCRTAISFIVAQTRTGQTAAATACDGMIHYR